MMNLNAGIRTHGSGWKDRPRRAKDDYPKARGRGDRFYITAVFHETNTLDDLAIRTKIFMERESAMERGF